MSEKCYAHIPICSNYLDIRLPMQDKAYIALRLNSLQQFSDSSLKKSFIIKDNKSASKIDFCAEGFDWAVDPTKMAVFAAISGSADSSKLGLTICSKPFKVIKSLALSTCISKNFYSSVIKTEIIDC